MVHNRGRRRETSHLWKEILPKIYKPVRKPNIRSFLKAKRLEWAGHIWRAGKNLIQNVLIKKPTKKRPKERPCQRWLGRVKKGISDTDKSMYLDDIIMDRNG